jgi:protein-tyrosine-phosphatase
MRTILFVCPNGSDSSQMAKAFFSRYAPAGMKAIAAASQPVKPLNPLVINVMRETGIDIGLQRLRLLTPYVLDEADMIVVVGHGKDTFHTPSFKPKVDWDVDDPREQPIEKVRRIRDEIDARVKFLIQRISNRNGTDNNAHIGGSFQRRLCQRGPSKKW